MKPLPIFALALLLGTQNSAFAAGPDLAELAGDWSGRQGCQNVTYHVKVSIRERKDHFILEYVSTPAARFRKNHKTERDFFKIWQSPEASFYKVQFNIPFKNPLNATTAMADVRLHKKEGRYFGRSNFGFFDKFVGVDGSMLVSKSRDRIDYNYQSWLLKRTDRCKGFIKKKKKEEAPPEPETPGDPDES